MSFLGNNKGRRNNLGNLLQILQGSTSKKRSSTSWSNLFGSAYEEYDSLNSATSTTIEQPFEQVNDGTFKFYVKMKLYEQKGEPIVERKIVITTKGVTFLDLVTDDVERDFPYECIKSFFYAEDDNFVVFIISHEDPKREENVVFRSNKQAPVIKSAIESSISERLRLDKEAKTQQKLAESNSTQKEKESSQTTDNNSNSKSQIAASNESVWRYKPTKPQDLGKSNASPTQSNSNSVSYTPKNSPQTPNQNQTQTQTTKTNDNAQTNSISFPVDWSQVQTNTTAKKNDRQKFQSSQGTTNSTSQPKSSSKAANVPDLIIWD